MRLVDMDSLEFTCAPTVSTATAYHFCVGKMGWVIYSLNEGTGGLSIQSDWGDAQYQWDMRHIGGTTLAEFVRTTDVHYLSEKLFIDRPNDREELDADKTVDALRGYVVEMRREGRVRKANARELWDEIRHWLDSSSSTETLWHTIPDCISRYIDDPSDFFQMVPSVRVLRIRQLLTLFKDYLTHVKAT